MEMGAVDTLSSVHEGANRAAPRSPGGGSARSLAVCAACPVLSSAGGVSPQPVIRALEQQQQPIMPSCEEHTLYQRMQEQFRVNHFVPFMNFQLQQGISEHAARAMWEQYERSQVMAQLLRSGECIRNPEGI